MSQKAQGKNLVFISRIKRDGTGVQMVEDQDDAQHYLADKTFKLNCLSITEGTYIASEFNSYVVKIKEK